MLLGIQQAAQILNRGDAPDHLHQWLGAAKLPQHELEVLAQCLTVGETYFFRELPGLMLLIEQVLPVLYKEGDTSVNIWSAGCSSGEEPYSLAMLIKEYVGNTKNLKINILATDINKSALEKAALGQYTSWSFRSIPESIKAKYFSGNGKNYVLHRDIVDMVTFRTLNLAADEFPVPSGSKQVWDMIFCRNVLMYMPEAKIEEISKKFEGVLKAGGWLVTSQVELNDHYFRNFQRVLINKGIYYRKLQGNLHALNIMQAASSEGSIATLGSDTSTRRNLPSTHIRPTSSTSNVGNHADGFVRAKKSQKSPAVNGTDDLPEHRANALYRQGDYEGCHRFCKETIAQSPYSQEIACCLISSLRNMGQYSEALKEVSVWTGLDEMNEALWLLAGNLQLEMSDYQSAEESFNKAMYLNPDSIEAMYGAFQGYLAMGDSKRARKILMNLLQKIDSIPDHEVLKGMDGLSSGRFRDILETYNLELK
jgi:chemotaxis protein methyltransferase CheR